MQVHKEDVGFNDMVSAAKPQTKCMATLIQCIGIVDFYNYNTRVTVQGSEKSHSTHYVGNLERAEGHLQYTQEFNNNVDGENKGRGLSLTAGGGQRSSVAFSKKAVPFLLARLAAHPAVSFVFVSILYSPALSMK